MAKRRLNDTGALVEQGSRGCGSYSVSARQIDNGFVVCESCCDPVTGEYTYSERFSASPPRLGPGASGPRSGTVGGTGLRGAVDYLKD